MRRNKPKVPINHGNFLHFTSFHLITIDRNKCWRFLFWLRFLAMLRAVVEFFCKFLPPVCRSIKLESVFWMFWFKKIRLKELITCGIISESMRTNCLFNLICCTVILNSIRAAIIAWPNNGDHIKSRLLFLLNSILSTFFFPFDFFGLHLDLYWR